MTKSHLLALGLALSFSTPYAFAGDKHAKHGAQAHWTYGGKADGAAQWGKLAGEYAMCAAGANQSPIDLSGAIKAEVQALAFEYNGSATAVVNNGHALQLVVAGENTLVSGGKRYRLLQAHFHTPSEHTLAGKSYPAEIHFVHKGEDGELAVVGFLIAEGDANQEYAPVLNGAPRQVNEPKAIVNARQLKALLGTDATYFLYRGSLTTPPCGEGVRWHVMKEPLKFSPEQIKGLAGLFKEGTARPVQPLNGRFLLEAK